MSDDLNSTDIENALFSLHLLKHALRTDGAQCCPNVWGSQLYNLLRSILYSNATLKEELLLGLVHALFSNQGAEFCKKGVCGNAECTFGSVAWEDYEQHPDCLLANDLAALLEARKDRTIFRDLAAELANGHRRAVANVIALFKHDHLCAKVLEGSALYVTAMDGHRRFLTVDTSAECATSVTASRFKDFNDLCDSTVDLEKVTQQQTHIVQTVTYTLAADTPPPPAPKKTKQKVGAKDAAVTATASLFCLAPTKLFEVIRTASSDESAGPETAPGLLFFSASMEPKPVQVLSKYPIVLFRTVPRVEYLPGVSGAESVCGGGVRGMRAAIEAAKRGSTFGDLYMGGNGQVEGWDRLPTLLEAQRVHSGACGTRPYNAWAGPLALEKAIEFGLPFVDAEGELTMTPHESATHAHHFVSHVAQLTQPRLLVTFAHDGTTAVEVKKTQLEEIRNAARALGFALHRSLVEFRGVEAKKRRELVEKAFSMGPGDAWELAMQARVGCEPAKKNAASQAALAVRLATLVCPDISHIWSPLFEELERFGTGAETPARFLSEGGATPARRAALMLRGHWFDVDVAGEAWPTPGTARSAGPFAHAEDSDIGTLALRLPPGETVAVGFLRAPAKTATSFSLVLEGHSSVSLTQGHLLVLEEAARHVLKSPSVCVAPASVANGWERVLPPQSSPPSPSPRVFHGTVVQNELVENPCTPTRRWTGHLKLQCEDGVHELTYHSFLIQNAVERKRTVQGGAVHHCEHLFPEAYGLDYTRRGTLAELAEGQEVVVTARALSEAVHAVLVSGPALGQSPHRKAVVPLYELTTDAAKPRIDGLNGVFAFLAWVVQRNGRSGLAVIISGQQGTGKSKVGDQTFVVLGPNTMRRVLKAEQEVEKQFGQEHTNTVLFYGDEVGDRFFKAADGAAMKEHITTDVNTHEVKTKQGMVKSANTTNFMFCTNEDVPDDKLKRRYMHVACANALKIDGVGGQAALSYFEVFDAELRSPYRNAGVLHFLAQYPLVSNLEVYSVDKSKTSSALSKTPKEFHLRFLVDLCEFPLGTHSLGDDIADVEKGWGEEGIVDRQELKVLLTGWHTNVCSRRESANDRLANPATSMLKKLETLFAGHATLAEMNAGQQPGSFRLSRAHLRRFLRSKKYNVRQPPGCAFYEDAADPAIQSAIAAIRECHKQECLDDRRQERPDATKTAASFAAWTVLDRACPEWQKTAYYCAVQNASTLGHGSFPTRAGVLKEMVDNLSKRGTFL